MKYDICIVGAGVAGATMAAYLSNKGIKSVIIEKNLSERDVIVGELLQPGGFALLKEMGLGSFVEGIDAQAVYGYDVIHGDEEYIVSYTRENEVPNGFGFRNGKFLQNMRSRLLADANVTVIEGKVTGLVQDEEAIHGVRFMEKGSEKEEMIEAHLTIVCDGPISRYRSELSNPKVKVNGYFLGIILEDCELPYPGHGHLVMGDHPPFVLYPVTQHEIRVLIDFPGETPPRLNDELKQHLLKVFLPVMPQKMKMSFEKAVGKGGFKMMPNHRLPAAPILKKGGVLLGDSLNMRHPLTGGGMTAAFSDVKTLGNQLAMVQDFSDESQVGQAVKNFYETRHLGNQTINILADGLYGVVNQADLRMAFFEYLKRGGKYAGEPINILGGLNKDKKLLQKHFFAVASYGTRLKLKRAAGTEKIEGSVNMMKEAVRIIGPLLLSEKPDAATKLLLQTIGNKV